MCKLLRHRQQQQQRREQVASHHVRQHEAWAYGGGARAYNEVMIVTMPRTNTGRVNAPIDPTDMQTMTPSTMARMSRILAPCCSEQQKHAKSSCQPHRRFTACSASGSAGHLEAASFRFSRCLVHWNSHEGTRFCIVPRGLHICASALYNTTPTTDH